MLRLVIAIIMVNCIAAETAQHAKYATLLPADADLPTSLKKLFSKTVSLDFVETPHWDVLTYFSGLATI